MTPRDELIEIADTIIADYNEHYSFPTQGESHMHDCIMDALEKFAARLDAQGERRKGERRGDYIDVENGKRCFGTDRRKQDAATEASAKQKRTPLSKESMEKRMPLRKPHELVDAMQDSIHTPTNKLAPTAPDAETPETDKLFDQVSDRETNGKVTMPNHWSYEAILDLTDFARSLERQRDAAVRELTRISDELGLPGKIGPADGWLRDQMELLRVTLARVRELEARIEALAKDAAIGEVVWKFIDRMNDVAPDCGDSAERILKEFVNAVKPSIDAALSERKGV